MNAIQPNKKNPPDHRRFTRKEIADLFTVSVETVKRRTVDGLLRPETVNSRVIHYTIDDVRVMVDQSYRLNLKKALLYGIQPADVGFPMPAKSMRPELVDGVPSVSDVEAHAVTSLGATQDNGFGATVFLAQFRWALRQPDVRDLLAQIVKEQGMPWGA